MELLHRLLRQFGFWLVIRHSKKESAELRADAWWILEHIKPAEDEVDTALRGAFTDCGLPQDSYSADFDIRHSGKLHEVLLHASARLGNPLHTVADLSNLLR